MKVRTATCHCGALVLLCTGMPIKISMCHCLDCQRRTGSAFSVAVFYARGSVTLQSGTSQEFDRESASGYPVRFNFCGTCGTNLYWEPSRLPELVGVALGAFADPHFPSPEQSVWTKDKHDWIALPASMRVYDVHPTSGGN